MCERREAFSPSTLSVWPRDLARPVMRSVVRHSVLFWAQGEQPPGWGSHRIFRTCRVGQKSDTGASACSQAVWERTLHLSQAWPVRFEAPFLRAPALASYSMCRSVLDDFAGMGGAPSSSPGRFAGIVPGGVRTRCLPSAVFAADHGWRRPPLLLSNERGAPALARRTAFLPRFSHARARRSSSRRGTAAC